MKHPQTVIEIHVQSLPIWAEILTASSGTYPVATTVKNSASSRERG
ncbi:MULTISPECIES: hypothetical protein [unclassified Anabaena]|nr:MULTISPECIES: hypothetical protein [unclassified Anabaena]